MGRSKFIGMNEGGQTAQVEIIRETNFASSKVRQLDAQIAQIDADLVLVENDLDAAEQQVADITALANSQINLFRQCVKDLTDLGQQTEVCNPYIEAAQHNITEAAIGAEDARAIKQIREQLKIERRMLEGRRDALAGVVQTGVPTTLVCSERIHEDWAPAAGVAIGTLELMGGARDPGSGLIVPKEKTLLRPLGNANTYIKSRDNIVEDSLTPPKESVFSHLATWAWVQEHRPVVITAQITAIDKDAHTCSVQRVVPLGLDPIPGVDYAWIASGVPIVYQWCHSRIFNVGDRVVVEFSGPDKTGAKVIGFESNPKYCDLELVYTAGNNGTVHLNGVPGTVHRQFVPYDDDALPVVAVGNPNYVFNTWSDGHQFALRHDKNVKFQGTLHATFKQDVWPNPIYCSVGRAPFPGGYTNNSAGLTVINAQSSTSGTYPNMVTTMTLNRQSCVEVPYTGETFYLIYGCTVLRYPTQIVLGSTDFTAIGGYHDPGDPYLDYWNIRFAGGRYDPQPTPLSVHGEWGMDTDIIRPFGGVWPNDVWAWEVGSAEGENVSCPPGAPSSNSFYATGEVVVTYYDMGDPAIAAAMWAQLSPPATIQIKQISTGIIRTYQDVGYIAGRRYYELVPI